MLTFRKILDTYQDWQDIGPSYDDPDTMVYSGDLWRLAELFSGNKTDCKTLNRITDIAEHYGIELRFYDETICDEQGRIHNTSPTHYGWTPTFRIFDGEIWAEDEVDSDTLESYADWLIDDSNQADQWGINFRPIGFKRHDEQGKSGFHYGQTDTPDNMRAAIEALHGPCEVIFTIDDTGQFDMRFGAWYRPTE